MPEVQIRTFRNFDPPHLVRLWNTAYQSRGVAAPISPDIFDIAVLAVPFFDPEGLIVAEIDGELVGFAHVGFCVNEDHTGLDHSEAVLCAIVVDPDHRHEEIGTRLLEQVRNYARSKGAGVLFAGPSPERDPFYNGIYGGSRPSGFLESQPSLIEFLAASGFEPVEQHGVFQKDLTTTREPINLKLVAIRRRMELQLGDDHRIEDWWWAARLGRYELLRFDLVPRNQLQAVASITVLGLDFFVSNWNHRAVGMLDLIVDEDERRKGYGQSLLIEVGRRLKDEMITLLEIHSPMHQTEMVKLITGAGFTQVDTGIVFRQDL